MNYKIVERFKNKEPTGLPMIGKARDNFKG